ncbi:MAG: hypothetical protein WD872_06285 [Pirellulaceae bacterium]
MKHARKSSTTWAGWALVALLLVAPSASAAEPPWELAPYRIQVLVAVEPGSGLPPHCEQDLCAALAARSAGAMGGVWQLAAQPAPIELRGALLKRIGRIRANEIPAAARKLDKLMLLGVIATDDGGWQAQARELDLATGLWNVSVGRRIEQAEQLESAALAALAAAFAPLARIEAVEKDKVTLRLRARLLYPRDVAPLAPGAALRPVLLQSDAAGQTEPGSARAIDWTYLLPSGTSGPTLTCNLVTALAGEAIPPDHPQRPRWAIGVSGSSAIATRLKLVSAGAQPTPLEAYQVFAQSPAAGSANELLGRSDGAGIVSIPGAAEAVRWISVRQGEQTVARVPLVPGLDEEVTLVLPENPERLELETMLAGVQDDIVDLVARREALAGRIRLAIENGQIDDARKMLADNRARTSIDPLLKALDRTSEAVKAGSSATREHLDPQIAALKALVEKLGTGSPLKEFE